MRNQRERLLAGFAQAVVEHGYQHTTITHISEAASVSRNTFYEQFESKEACFLAAYGEVSEHVRSAMCAAAESHDEWAEGVAAAIAATIAFFAEAPGLARLCLVESVAAGPPVAANHRDTLEFYADQLRAAQPKRSKQDQLAGVTEEVLISGTVSLITRRLNEGRDKQLPALVPELIEIILAPYVGEGEAERLASQATPSA